MSVQCPLSYFIFTVCNYLPYQISKHISITTPPDDPRPFQDMELCQYECTYMCVSSVIRY